MDPPATADDPTSSTHSTSTLRKRLLLLPIDTSSPSLGGGGGKGDWSREPAKPPGTTTTEQRASTAPQGEEEQEGSMAGREKEEEEEAAAAGEPMSPAGRLFRERHFNCHIVAVIGLGKAVDVAAARRGLEATLVRHPRFCSVQVKDDVKKNAKPRWVRTTVNLNDHIIFPNLDPAATWANPDQAIEDYLSSLSTAPMDHSRPLWELHVLDFPTSEATSTVAIRMHHSLGDGVSLLSLLIACTRSAADPARLPELPPAPARRAGQPTPLAAGVAAILLWAWSFVVLAWHTMVDVLRFVASAWFLRDPTTPFMGAQGVEFSRKRIVHRTLSLDDVKFIKNAMKCTVNDVFVGVTCAGLSRYYFRKTSDANSERKKPQKKNVCVRSALLVNIRKTPGLHALAEMMDSRRKHPWKQYSRTGAGT
ncbi:hypothetical protein QOZ80_5AG0363820 [Eleusine coracana subsp. coracana]|nr:hypothetical protein QOZ80_5AG0363820 [Eleusine coracana subsp. coracana]